MDWVVSLSGRSSIHLLAIGAVLSACAARKPPQVASSGESPPPVPILTVPETWDNGAKAALEELDSQLRRSRVERIFAALDGEPASVPPMADVRRWVQLAKRYESHRHVLEALRDVRISDLASDDPLRSDYLHAIDRIARIPDAGLYRRAFEFFRSDPVALVRLNRKAPYGSDVPEPSDEDLRAAGSAALDLLGQRLRRAIRESDVDRALALAKEVLKVDPLDLRASTVVLASEDLGAGLRRNGNLAWLAGGSINLPTSQSLARLDHHLEVHGARSKTIHRLAYATYAWRSGLLGDCRAVLERAGGSADEPTSPVAVQEALCAFASGDVPSYQRWARQAQPERSSFVCDFLSEQIDDETPTAMREEALSVTGRALRRGVTARDSGLYLHLLTWPKAPQSVRDLARDHLLSKGWDEHLLRACADRSLDHESCQGLFYSAWTIADPEDGSVTLDVALERLRDIEGYDLDFDELANHLYPPSMEPIITALARAGTTATSQAQLFLSLVAQIHRGNPDVCEAQLNRHGQHLTPMQELVLHLAVASLRGGASPERIIEDIWVPGVPLHLEAIEPKTADEDVVRRCEQEWYPEAHPLAQLLRGFAYVNSADLERAVGSWEPLTAQVSGRAKAVLQASVAAARLRLGEIDAADRLLAASLPVLGEQAYAKVLAARVLEARSRTAAAHAAYRQAMLANSDSESLAIALLRTANASSAAMVSALARMRPGYSRFGGRYRDVEMVETLDAQQIVAVLEGDAEEIARLLEKGTRLPESTVSALRTFENEMGEAGDLGRVIELAKRCIAILSSGGDLDSYRERLAWFHFLSGEVDAALETADARIEGEPLDEAHPIRLLSDARRSGAIDDELAVAIWRARTGGTAAHVKVVEEVQKRRLHHPGVQAYVCRALVDASLIDAAVEACFFAWKHATKTDDLAAAVSYVHLSANPSSDTAMEGREIFAESSDSAGWSTWNFNRGMWLIDSGDADAGQAAIALAWRNGFDISGAGLGEKGWLATQGRARLFRRYMTARSQELEWPARMAFNAWDALALGRPRLAHYYARAALDLGIDADSREGSVALLSLDLADMLAWDLRAKNLDIDVVRAALLAMAEGKTSLNIERSKKHPRSVLLRLMHLEALFARGEHAAAAKMGATLADQFPNSRAVMIDTISALLAANRLEEARALLRRGLLVFPKDERLQALARAVRWQLDAELPPELEQPETVYGKLAEARLTARALESARRVDVDTGVEVFLPVGFEPDPSFDFRFVSNEGTLLNITATPRVSRCTPPRCHSRIEPGFAKLGFRMLWKRQLALPAADAVQSFWAAGNRIIVMWVVPIGARIFALTASAHADTLDEALPAATMLADSFRLLSGSVSADAAEALRGRLWRMPGDGVRLRGRQALASQEEGDTRCPVDAAFDSKAPEAERAALLVDLFLSAPDDAHRRHLLNCGSPRSKVYERAGLLALLSEDPKLHAFGRRVVASRADVSARDAHSLLIGLQSNGRDAFTGLAPYGALEAMLALPGKKRREFVRDLLHSDSTDSHMIGLAAGLLQRDLVPPAVIQADVRAASPTVAMLAARVAEPDESTVLDAARERLERLRDLAVPSNANLARALMFRLASRLEPADAQVLGGVLRRAEKQGAAMREEAERLVRAHRRGIEIRARGTPSFTDEDRLASEWVTALQIVKTKTKQRAVSPEQLHDRTLAELLPSGPWSYVRVPQPGLTVAAASSLFARIDFGQDATGMMARFGVEMVVRQMGGELLNPDGGLDLQRPIECAGVSGGQFVCSAYVKNPDRVMQLLGERRTGSDAGISMFLRASMAALFLPIGLAITPAVVDSLLHREASEAGPARLLSERLRATEEIAGHSLHRYATVELHEGKQVLVDDEYLLLIRDRLFVFGGSYPLHELLDRPPPSGTSFAASEGFTRAARTWPDGAGLQGLLTSTDSSGQRETVSTVAALDSNGINVEWKVFETGQGQGRAADLLALLPAGAASRIAFDVDAASPWVREADLADAFSSEHREESPTPPAWLLDSQSMAIGWYPRKGGGVWRDWVAVLPWTSSSAKLLERSDWPRPRSHAIEHRGLWVSLQGEHLVLTSSSEPVSLTEVGRPMLPANVAVDVKAERAAESIAAIIEEADVDARRKMEARTYALFVGSATEATIEDRWDAADGAQTISGRLGFRTIPAKQSRLVKEWLAAHNRIALPRNAPPSGQTVSYEIRVQDAAKFVATALAPERSRVSVAVVDPQTVEVRVAASPPLDTAVPKKDLDAASRRRLLADEGKIRATSAKVRAAAARIAGDSLPATDAVEKVVRFVHGLLSYEVTPSAIDAVELLSRRRGDCSEYAVLTVSLLRSLGIPAEVEEGFLASGDAMVAHAWVRYHDGTGWREIDPTANRTRVGPGYLPATVAEVIGALALGRLSVVDVRSGQQQLPVPVGDN